MNIFSKQNSVYKGKLDICKYTNYLERYYWINKEVYQLNSSKTIQILTTIIYFYPIIVKEFIFEKWKVGKYSKLRLILASDIKKPHISQL